MKFKVKLVSLLFMDLNSPEMLLWKNLRKDNLLLKFILMLKPLMGLFLEFLSWLSLPDSKIN